MKNSSLLVVVVFAISCWVWAGVDAGKTPSLNCSIGQTGNIKKNKKAIRDDEENPEPTGPCNMKIILGSFTKFEGGGQCPGQGPGYYLANINTEDRYHCALKKIKEAGRPKATSFWTSGSRDLTTWVHYDVVGNTFEPITKWYPEGQRGPFHATIIDNCVALRRLFTDGSEPEVRARYEMNPENCSGRQSVLCNDNNAP